MKIYVDELPKECCGCPCCNNDIDYGSCCNLGAYEYYEYHQTTTRHNKCPLQTIADLEAKLAEKEKEIEKLKTLVDVIDKYRQYDKDAKNLLLFNPDNCYTNGHQVVIKTNNQDKIDFAVEQLERVRDGFFDIANGWWLCFKNGTQYMTHNELEGCWREIFNQLITEIKEGK
jgi:hypothetical protein